MIRPATLSDVPDLAKIHVTAWQETYPGLLPQAEIAKRNYPYRCRLWTKMINAKATRIMIAPGAGFAQMGPQRDDGFRQNYPEELWAIYVVGSAQRKGLGRRLLAAVAGSAPFTALQVSGNTQATAFYRAAGAEFLVQREITEGDLTFSEDALGFTPPLSFVGAH